MERPGPPLSLSGRRAAVVARAAREIEAHRAQEQFAAQQKQEHQKLQTSLNSSSSSASLRSSLDSPRRKKAKKQKSNGDGEGAVSITAIPPTPPAFVFPHQPTPVFERASSQSDSTASLPTVDPMRTEQYKSVMGYRDGYSDSLLSKRPSGDDLESDEDSVGLDTDYFEEDAFYSESRNLDDWNVRFQEAQSVIQEFDANTNLKDRIGVNVALIHLYQDFLYSVRTYGRIIISELYLPPEQRTIRPSKLGGVAGGVKYLVNNILFKFAINHSNLYADDSAAAKVAGLELKSLISYLNCEIGELHYPLMALVDYRGFRLVAMSLLPIGKETIVYGTDDAGATIHSKDQYLSGLMERAAQKLNLQPHRCADLSRRHFEVLHSAADIEGHKGIDGRYYLIDFSRTFPPENPDKDLKMSHLFQLFRPEFVHSYHKPLCSDAFSKFILSEELKKYNEDIREATEILHTVTVPRVTIEMEAELKELLGVNSLQHFRLIENVHSSGVNVRYLGRIRSHCKSLELRAMILVETVARLLKSLMRLHLREMMKKLRVPLEQPYRRFAVDYLNLVFGNSDKSTRYWNERLKPKLRAKFTECLTEEEASNTFCLKQAISAISLSGKSGGLLVFEKVSAMMGLQFSPVIYTQLSDNPSAFLASAAPFDYVDLEELREIVKHTNVMAHSQGYLFKMKGLQRHQAGDFSSATRFFRMAIEKCEESLNSNPNHKLTLRNCGQLITFVDGALLPGKKGDFNSPTMKRADRYFKRAIKADPTDAHSHFQYARFLNYCNSEHAEEYYLRTMELDPTFERCLHEYAEFLAAHGNIDEAHKIQTIVSNAREMVPLEGFKSRQLRLSKSTLSSSADASSIHGSGGRSSRDHHMRSMSERDPSH